MIGHAHEDQLYKGSGFWEMRWNLGQFPDIAEQVKEAGISHIICAGISGCVVGEYLGLEMIGSDVPVDHMIFERVDRSPVMGVLPVNFELEGKQNFTDRRCGPGSQDAGGDDEYIEFHAARPGILALRAGHRRQRRDPAWFAADQENFQV